MVEEGWVAAVAQRLVASGRWAGPRLGVSSLDLVS